MKKLIVLLLALLMLLPAAAFADGLHAQVIAYGEETTVLFTDEDGDMYLIFVSEDGAQAISVSGSQSAPVGGTQSAPIGGTQKPPVQSDATCWRCGESLASGDHTAGNCGYKYHSACMDQYFKDEYGHELCPICDQCMYSSGSRHGIGYGLCGATLMLENDTCKVCGGKLSDHYIHTYGAPYSECWGHCYLTDELHPLCPICGDALCNGEEHSAKGCAKKLQGNG